MTIAIASGVTDQEKPHLLISNLFTQGTVNTSSETTDGAGTNALNDGTFDYWTAAVATADIEVDMTTATACSMAGIAAHTLGTEGATVAVESSTDGTTWTSRASATPADDSTIVLLWPSVSARYWRVKVTNGPASIGVLKIGARLVVPSGVALGHVSIDNAARVELLSNDSLDGQFLGTRIVRRSADISLDMGLVERDFIEDDFAGFRDSYNEGRAFFYAGSPANLPLDVGYCKRPANGGEIRPSHVGGDLMQLQFGAQVYVG